MNIKKLFRGSFALPVVAAALLTGCGDAPAPAPTPTTTAPPVKAAPEKVAPIKATDASTP